MLLGIVKTLLVYLGQFFSHKQNYVTGGSASYPLILRGLACEHLKRKLRYYYTNYKYKRFLINYQSFRENGA